MTTFLALALGGALGGTCRYLATQALDRRLGTAFPWGTLAVNCSGALLAGLAAGLFQQRGDSGMAELFLLAGFCGSYTTVSSWSLQTLALLHRRYYLRAAANLIITLVLGLAAIGLGLYLAGSVGGVL